MSQTTFSVRMDSEVKRQLDEFCAMVGMNTTTAFNLFARAVLREGRLPFDVTTLKSQPNAETLEALAQVQRMKETPSAYKGYQDVDAMMKELLA